MAGPLAPLRARGARGGVIPPHRSMVQLRWTGRRAARAAILALAGFAATLALLPALGRLWGLFFPWALEALGLPSPIGWHLLEPSPLIRIAVPYPLLDGPDPGRGHWLAVGGATLAALLASFLLPARYLPARYFLRFVVAVQAVSLGYFALGRPFPYPLPGYLGGLLSAGMAVLTLVPIALGLGFYIFDHSLARQVLLTVLVLGHLAILLPLQSLVHAYLIHRLSLLVQPTLFFIFGLWVEVLVVVAFYGWAMSWPGKEMPRAEPTGSGGGA